MANKMINGVISEMQNEEINQLNAEFRKQDVIELHRQLTQYEVLNILAKAQVNTLDIDDQTSLRMLDYYPTFDEVIGQTVSQGFKFTYNGNLYKVIQAHTFSSAWIPDNGTESLYTRIDEEHDGDLYDPIPYEGNMALINGKYYIQNGVTYKCTKDTINPVYNALSELIGLYVEESTL